MAWLYRQYRGLSTAQKFVMNALMLLMIFYGAGYGVTNIFKTSQQRSIEACVDDLKQSVQKIVWSEAIQECQKLCRQGDIANCP
jgi:hypothetical protein